MAERIDIAGHPTWVEQRGPLRSAGGRSGDAVPVLLLHGGLSNSDSMLDAIGAPLAARGGVVAFDRRGHGYTADTDAPFHYDDMATETVGVLETVVGGPADLVGWSDGGIVALLVAERRPDLVRRMVVIGANFHFDGVLPIDLDPSSAMTIGMAQLYGERSPDGIEHFGVVAAKASTMMATEPTMGPDDLAGIGAPTLVMAGDDDLIRLDHTCALYESLAAGQLAIVPGSSHALPVERPDEVARIIIDFLDAPAVPATLIPVRRALDSPAQH